MTYSGFLLQNDTPAAKPAEPGGCSADNRSSLYGIVGHLDASLYAFYQKAPSEPKFEKCKSPGTYVL